MDERLRTRANGTVVAGPRGGTAAPNRPAGEQLMDHQVVAARPLGAYRVHVVFRDGTSGIVDLEPFLLGPLFMALREPNYFGSLTVHPVLHTLTWPNGADVAPDVLHAFVNGK